MRKTIFALLVLGLFSCRGFDICQEADYYLEDYGVCVQTNGFEVNREHLEYMFEETRLAVVERFDGYTEKNTRKIFSDHQVSIRFMEEVIYGVGEFSVRCNGLCEYDQWNRTFILSIKHFGSDCLAETAFVHELLHVYLLAIEEDAGHPVEWFSQDGETAEEKMSSLEYVLNKRFFCELCATNEDYPLCRESIE